MRKLKKKYICGCRCYERLQPNTKDFTHLSYTELVLELEYLKIETRLITEMFANVMGECLKLIQDSRAAKVKERRSQVWLC